MSGPGPDGGGQREVPPGGDAIAPDGGYLPDSGNRCRPFQPYDGRRAFTDVTDEVGLTELGVAGVRLGSVDVDGDGRPDLIVRDHAAGVRDDFGPGGVRHTWLLRNVADGGGAGGAFRFEDVTRQSGFTATRDGGEGRTVHIAIFGDVDNDGDLDAFTGVAVDPSPDGPDNGDRSEVLLNAGDGTFTLAAGGDVRRPDERPPTFGASFLDHDRDGRLDLWVGYALGAFEPEPDRLYRGDGAGSFVDVTEEAGLMTRSWSRMSAIREGTAHRNTWGTAACDLNGDGWPDLISSVYGRYFNAMWLATGDGGFVDHSMDSGLASDDRMDWTTNLNARCFCKLNPDAEDCAGVPAPPRHFGCSRNRPLRWDHDTDRQAWRLGGNTFSTVCGDIDNDGDLDLMNFEIVHWDVGDSSDPTEPLLNDGGVAPRFERPGNDRTGLVREWPDVDWNAGDMTGAFLDFDNDGRKDILIASSDYPGTRAFLFRQLEDGTFAEVPPEAGIDHPRAHGVAVADFDGDGDLDVALGHGRARCEGDPSCLPRAEVHLFRNDVGQDGNFLRILLVGGPGSNRSAIGARVSVTAGGFTQVQEVGGGHGHFGIQHELTLHFGLGAACAVDRIEVRWPDAAGTVDVFSGVRANSRIRITEGAQAVEYLPDP